MFFFFVCLFFFYCKGAYAIAVQYYLTLVIGVCISDLKEQRFRYFKEETRNVRKCSRKI